MSINLGSNKIKAISVGSEKIKEVYVGSIKVWSSILGVVVMVDSYGWIFYSINKAQLVRVTLSPPQYRATGLQTTNSVAFGNDIFLAIIFDNSGTASGTYSNLGVSKDGVNWESLYNSLFSSLTIYSQYLSFNNGYFTVPGGNGWLHYSIDGKSWTSNIILSQKKFIEILFANGKYLATVKDDIRLFYTTTINGSWTPVSSYMASSMAYGLGKVIGHSPDNGFVKLNETTMKWEIVSTSLTISNESRMIFDNGKFVAIFKSSNTTDLAYSSDGETWTTVVLPEQVESISYDGDNFVLGTRVTDRYLYSSNLISWTTVVNPYGITYAVSGICAK